MDVEPSYWHIKARFKIYFALSFWESYVITFGQKPCQHISAFILGSAAFNGSSVSVVLWNNCYLF